MTVVDRTGTTTRPARFEDLSGPPPLRADAWRPVKVTRAEIESEIERLAGGPLPEGGRRVSAIVHPEATGPGLGFAPGVRVALEVLLPGEATTPVRANSTAVCIGIRGRGVATVGDRDIAVDRWDVVNVPSMREQSFRNTGDDLWVRLTYTNEPLLEKLGAAYREPAAATAGPDSSTPATPGSGKYRRTSAPDHEISEYGARLRGYEYITDVEFVENDARLWPWSEVSSHLSETLGDGKRTILVLANPSTGRLSGATHSFFVTATHVPPGASPRDPAKPGHRHTSMAINYHFEGSGSSVVDGEIIEWEAGDLLLSAPGWREHAHSPGPDGISVFTVQDHPLHIGMESLIWQEDMSGPVLTLGSEAGLTGYIGPREEGS